MAALFWQENFAEKMQFDSCVDLEDFLERFSEWALGNNLRLPKYYTVALAYALDPCSSGMMTFSRFKLINLTFGPFQYLAARLTASLIDRSGSKPELFSWFHMTSVRQVCERALEQWKGEGECFLMRLTENYRSKAVVGKIVVSRYNPAGFSDGALFRHTQLYNRIDVQPSGFSYRQRQGDKLQSRYGVRNCVCVEKPPESFHCCLQDVARNIPNSPRPCPHNFNVKDYCSYLDMENRYRVDQAPEAYDAVNLREVSKDGDVYDAVHFSSGAANSECLSTSSSAAEAYDAVALAGQHDGRAQGPARLK